MQWYSGKCLTTVDQGLNTVVVSWGKVDKGPGVVNLGHDNDPRIESSGLEVQACRDMGLNPDF